MKKKALCILLTVLVLVLSACGAQDKGGDASAGTKRQESREQQEKQDEQEKSEEELFDLSVRDAAFADEDEILPLVSLSKDDKMATFDDEGRVLLCTWHNYPDSYPVGEDVTIE